MVYVCSTRFAPAQVRSTCTTLPLACNRLDKTFTVCLSCLSSRVHCRLLFLLCLIHLSALARCGFTDQIGMKRAGQSTGWNGMGGPINGMERNGRTNQVMEGMAADGMDSSFMAIFGEFLEGYSKCAIRAGTTPEQFQFSIGTLIKASVTSKEGGYTGLFWWSIQVCVVSRCRPPHSHCRGRARCTCRGSGISGEGGGRADGGWGVVVMRCCYPGWRIFHRKRRESVCAVWLCCRSTVAPAYI